MNTLRSWSIKDPQAQLVQSLDIKWEVFEKAIGNSPAHSIDVRLLTAFEHDLVLVPCASGIGSKSGAHWYLLVAKPKQQQIFVLDSLAASGDVKPSAQINISKMWYLLKEVEPSMTQDPKQWQFFVNSQSEIPRQQNGFDCGVFVCLYARCLTAKSPMCTSDSICNFRKHLLLELHNCKLQEFVEPHPNMQKYYAVEYQQRFYFGRTIHRDDSTATFKFLHSIPGSGVFDWPRPDDIDQCHLSTIFYGPLSISGNSPFNFPKASEVHQVYTNIKKTRNTHCK